MNIQTLKTTLCNCQCISGSVSLTETGTSATLTKVTICDIPANSLVIKMDKTRFSKFFLDNKDWGYNKHSDYLIVTDDKLVFVEIKSQQNITQKLKEYCEKKFLSDECTTKYADNIIEKLMNKSSFFNKRDKHFVLLYQALSMSKTPTTIGGMLKANTTPSTFRPIAVVNGETISYQKVI